MIPLRGYIFSLQNKYVTNKTKQKQVPRISQAEWEVMKVLWSSHPATAAEVVERLQKTGEWHPKTAKTLLGRLVKKGAVGFKKDGRAFLYSPLFNEEECIQAESESFLERFFSGALKPMLAHFVQKRKISSAELQELQRLLDDKKR